VTRDEALKLIEDRKSEVTGGELLKLNLLQAKILGLTDEEWESVWEKILSGNVVH
jgi:hypothetical protein